MINWIPISADELKKWHFIDCIVCSDGCTQPLEYYIKPNGKYVLVLGTVCGFGCIDEPFYASEEYEDIRYYEGFFYPAYLITKKSGKWGLFRYTHNVDYDDPDYKRYCGYKLILKEPFVYDSSEILEKMYIFKPPVFNPEEWKKTFELAKKEPDEIERFKKLHSLRLCIFEETKLYLEHESYREHGSNRAIKLPKPGKSICYSEEIQLPPNEHRFTTEFEVLGEDCLKTAYDYQAENPIVLNMANRKIPGGGVESGAGAQEECLFRSSNYALSLYPMRKYYPLDQNYGGIYSPAVTVFRGSESNGYPLLEKPFKVSFVAVAGLNRPHLINGKYNAIEKQGMINKIRTILNIAAIHGHTILILSALGCGAFRNPPEEVAKLFKEELNSDIYNGRFSKVIFAIKKDHNDLQGNYQKFYDVFYK